VSFQIDKTRIAIRQRPYGEILDLALRVIRSSPGALGLLLAFGAVPAMLVNHWVLGGLAENAPASDVPYAYLWHTVVLAIWEAPLVTAPATLYLGRALFVPRPTLREVLGVLRGLLGQLVYYHVVLRGAILLLVVFWYLEATRGGRLPLDDPGIRFFIVILYVVWFVWIMRVPYLNEVILLERNPMRASRPDLMTTRRRAKDLHSRGRGDIRVRWMAAATVAVLLVASVWLSIAVVRGALLNQWQGDPVRFLFRTLGGLLLNRWEGDAVMFTLYFPLAVWIVACFFTIVRYLAYLDLRIGSEGWDVELAMYAERDRLQGPAT